MQGECLTGNKHPLYLVPSNDAALALSQEDVNPSLRKALTDESKWEGVGQLANHTCCETHGNVELEFITVQEAEEDENGNDLTTVNPKVAVVLRATLAIQPGEFLRANYTDQPKDLQRIFQCTCYEHVGPCHPHGQISALALAKRVQVHPGWGTRQQITKGAQERVRMGGKYQEWKVQKVGRVVQIQRKDSTLEDETCWFFYDTKSKSFRLQQMGFFS